MAAHIMSNSMIDGIVTGADRIALNGDTANKIGTHGLAIIAKEYSVPFYIAAPSSTFDFSIKTGKEIVIEERNGDEIRKVVGKTQIVPTGSDVFNPAFDVTPARLIDGIITEKGIIKPPFEENIRRFFGVE
jgi:methylthioribose-1-phosphate isomerase